jgi:hypothetical protein
MKTEQQITRDIEKIKDMIEEYSECKDDHDSRKTAKDIYELITGKSTRCPYTFMFCTDDACRNCEIWIHNSGLCISH